MRAQLRRGISGVCLTLTAILLPVGVVSVWANATFFDSRTFSERTVALLDSQAMRRELAERITEQLALAGNQQAINFRPAFQLAIEAAVNTDAFRSVFRSAVMRAHQELLRKGEAGALDLSESVSIIANTLQLAQANRPAEADERTLDATLTDVTRRVSDIRVWRLRTISTAVAWVSAVAALALAATAVAASTDHRGAVRRLGWIVVADGILISGLVVALVWFSGTVVSDDQLAQAIQDGVESWTGDLRTVGLWVAGYGIVVSAAAASGIRRITPGSTAQTVSAWVERQRATTPGTLGLGVLFVVAGAMLLAAPAFWLRLALLGLGLWLVYFGVTEVLALVRARAVEPATVEPGWHPVAPTLVLSAVAIAAVLGVMSAGLLVTTGRAAHEANALGAARCNGDASLCDLPLNRVMFPGTHNSMSAALNPGWLFAEHVRTIGSQLESGVRALLIDTHYGVPSSSRLPGFDTPVILTDRAAELSHPALEQADPATAARAAELAARSPPRADAIRDLYLCHNYCELGAIRFADALSEIKRFLDTHPDDVVMLIIQDATTPADTAGAIVRAGLEERVFTLEPGRPLPTLRSMVESRRTLLVFAEEGGPGAPPWYHRAYETWFQETPYEFHTPADMSCAPNRGTPGAPLFLVNHWLHASPPDPGKAATANARAPLAARLRRCVEERGALPNVVAVDFAERGDVVQTVRDLTEPLLDRLRQVKAQDRPPPSATVAPTTTTTSLGPVTAPSPRPLPAPTAVTSLTGGDPDGLCARLPAMRSVVSAWALAQVVAPPGGRTLSDLAFGPAADRAFDAVAASLPVELAQVWAPTRDRAEAATQALRDAGLSAAGLDELADMAESRLLRDEYPDPAAAQTALIERERSLLGGSRLDDAAAALAARPEAAGLFDLGDVPDEVARGRGFACLADQAG